MMDRPFTGADHHLVTMADDGRAAYRPKTGFLQS
jgi:hypothetical protein